MPGWGPEPGSHFNSGHAPADVLDQARSLADICLRHGTRLPAAALQFPLRHPAVTAVVAGMRTADEVKAALRLLAEPVPEAGRIRPGKSKTFIPNGRWRL